MMCTPLLGLGKSQVTNLEESIVFHLTTQWPHFSSSRDLLSKQFDSLGDSYSWNQSVKKKGPWGFLH